MLIDVFAIGELEKTGGRQSLLQRQMEPDRQMCKSIGIAQRMKNDYQQQDD